MEKEGIRTPRAFAPVPYRGTATTCSRGLSLHNDASLWGKQPHPLVLSPCEMGLPPCKAHLGRYDT